MRKSLLLLLLLGLTFTAIAFAETDVESPQDDEEMPEAPAAEEEEEGDDNVDYDDEENVVKLTPDEVEKYVMDPVNEFLFVEFYAPWCGYCKMLKPEWVKAANEAKEKEINIKFVAVNADGMDEDSPLKQYNIMGFPTIKFFHAGVPKEYEGERNAEDMLKFAKSASKEPVVEILKDKDAVLNFIKESKSAVIGYFAKNLEKEEGSDTVYPREAFDVAAHNLRMDFDFAEVIDPEMCKEAGVEDASVKVHLRDGSIEEMKPEDGDMAQPGSISKWIMDNSKPLLEDLTQFNFEKLVAGTELPSFILFVDPTDSEIPAKEWLKKIALDNRGDMQAFTMDGVEYESFLDHLGFAKGHSLPSFAVLAPAERNHFILDKEVTEESINKFYDDFVAKKLTRKLKSAPIPEEQTEDVMVIVGDSFEEVTGDATKDVLVMFHAPWCGHCKALMPKYKKLARALKGVDSIIIGKIDMDANEVPSSLGIEGFPTVKLFKADDKENPIDFQGGRTFNAMLSFLKENAAIEFTVPKKEKKEKEEEKEEKDEL